MKIVCQSCSTQYSIADDKVQGKKVFKIRCKKCGEDILVRSESGDSDAPMDEPIASPAPLGPEIVAAVFDAMHLGYERREDGDFVGVLAVKDGRFVFRAEIKDTQLIMTSMLGDVARARWAEAILDINQFHRDSYRPKLFLPVKEAEESVSIVAEDIFEAPIGCTPESLRGWLSGHFRGCIEAKTKLCPEPG